MYNYYFKIDEDDNVIDYFNGVLRTPEPTDIFDRGRNERHFHLSLYDFQKKKYKYRYKDGRITLKTTKEMEPTTEEIQSDKENQLLQYIQHNLSQKLVDMASNKDSLDNLYDWIDTKKIELEI